jgi:ubiquitin-protein ligase
MKPFGNSYTILSETYFYVLECSDELWQFFIFSEPNNDSPMNAQAAAMWSDKFEMRQHVLLEHKKSESQ